MSTARTRPFPVRIDPSAFAQVLHNLIDNAVKYSGESRWIGVRLSSNGATVRICVEDRASGSRPNELPHIFERFHRVRNGLEAGRAGQWPGARDRRSYRGGLTAGGFSCRAGPAAAQSSPWSCPPWRVHDDRRSTPSRKVLIVEDDEAMATALADGFAFEGFAVTRVSDGAAGLEQASSRASISSSST